MASIASFRAPSASLKIGDKLADGIRAEIYFIIRRQGVDFARPIDQFIEGIAGWRVTICRPNHAPSLAIN
jgi:hypothetical protein